MSETKSVSGGAPGTLTETRPVTGGQPVPSPTLVQTDQSTILGDGSHDRPLHTSAVPGAVVVEDEGVPIANNPHDTLNFVGAGVTAVDSGGGVATVTVPGGIAVQDEGAPIANNPHATVNFVGAGVTAADGGGSVATVTIPGGIAGITVQDEGAPIANNPHTTVNFVGAGVAATDVAGVATVTVPGGIAVQDEGAPIANNPHATVNFVGAGVTAADGGGSVATVTIPGGIAGITVQDEGAPIANNPHTTVNFVGAGVAATDVAGVATVTIPGGGGTTNVFNQGVALVGNPHTFVNFSGDGVNAFDNGGGEAKVVIPITGFAQWGALDVGPLADTRFLGPGQIATALPTDVQGIPVPYNCTLHNLVVRHNVAGGDGNNVVYTVMLNGVATTITATLATGAVGTASDTSHSASASFGDTLSLRAVKPVAVVSGVINSFATLLLG